MRYAKVPETVELIDDRDGTRGTLSFYKYACMAWLDDAAWMTPKSNLASLLKVIAECKREPGETMHFEDADWAILCHVIRTPSGPASGIRPTIALQMMGYERAVLEAVLSFA